ncbi:hypothetical protein JAAARDRAFT_616626 [Jaapia argillacea MUCL 33604]|uniref:Peptidase M43 pregnancy-associated plasma-A domain-containing protein n=1 Tax=Jaapia argillacea MUCL 33604 TaxID=933084 RepID=A0A067PF91_9AGAM|nr:hypothetical protein JAAARDRAFT_616626 [Jaapia argillacea MUCL 33604]
MIFLQLSCVLLAIVCLTLESVLALPAPPAGRCGSEATANGVLLAEAHFREHLVLPDKANSAFSAVCPVISVYWNIICDINTLEGGCIPDTYIENQLAVLNRAFAATEISFQSANISRWLEPAWFTLSSIPADAAPMKQSLAVRNPDVLNVYTVGGLPKPSAGTGITLGYSSFPWEYTTDPISDGVVVIFPTLPGGGLAKQDLGANLIHEVGHWSGLWHTFQGGCTSPGDFVSDTPAEVVPSSGCLTVTPDSCPDDPGRTQFIILWITRMIRVDISSPQFR